MNYLRMLKKPRQARSGAVTKPWDAPEHYRVRMFERLKDKFSDDLLTVYARESNILLPNENLAEWPLHNVPTTKDEMEKLEQDVEDFVKNPLEK